jgi:uncharacterized protein YecE (DUF72 family)
MSPGLDPDRHLVVDPTRRSSKTGTSTRRREDRGETLQFYASQFPLVEVDSTYYFPPSERQFRSVDRATPENFTFKHKAYSLLTNHPTRPNSSIRICSPPIPEGKRNVYREQLPDEVVDEGLATLP